MASFFGISGDTSSFFSSFTETSGSSGSSSILGDYSMIRNGTYKKLLNKYYSEEEKNTKEAASETEEGKKSSKALAQTKSATTDLNKAAQALKTTDFSNKEESEKNVKAFVDKYNEVITQAADVTDESVLRKSLRMIKNTNVSKGLLSEVGIKVGADNKLTLDSETFKKADASTLKTMFTGTNSFADRIAGKASEISNLSNTAMNAGKKGSAYTNKGDYSSLDTNKLYNTLF